MQNTILNTENLSVMENAVDDIILIEEPTSEDQSKTKLRIGGVVLGKLVRFVK